MSYCDLLRTKQTHLFYGCTYLGDDICFLSFQKRATDEAVWPQIFIFPEGTCTNGRALIKFKTGAFQVNQSHYIPVVLYILTSVP